MPTNTPTSSDDELRKEIENCIRHARANVGFTLNSHEAAEQNISMNTEHIMSLIKQDREARNNRLEKEIADNLQMFYLMGDYKTKYDAIEWSRVKRILSDSTPPTSEAQDE